MGDRTGEGRVVGFARRKDGPGVVVTDYLEQRSTTIETDQPPCFSPSDPDSFIAPLDDAVTFYASELRLERAHICHLFDENGANLTSIADGEVELPRGTYYVDCQGIPHMYIRTFESALTMTVSERETGFEVCVAFDGPARVEVGVRSSHDRPAATITVGDDPRDLLTAVSYLGSGVKEWSAERSWPTVRGYPPAIERGDALSVPSGLDAPDTGITLSVPVEYAPIYRAAPLAFYLGASLEPADGDDVVLHLENGYTESLGTGRDLEATVDDLLARCLFLDSLVRIGGYYEFERYEYEAAAPTLPFYPPELYDSSISEQLMEYLEVPFADIEPYLPEWPLAATLRDGPRDVELLPHLANTLARVRVDDGTGTPVQTADISPVAIRGVSGDAVPREGSALSVSGFERSLDVTPPTRGEATVTLLDSPASVAAMRPVARGHGQQDETPVVQTVTDATTDDLARVLRSTADCVAVGGRATDEGIVCVDGVLSFDDVTVDVTTVLLADGDSVEPGVRLVDAGAANVLVAASDATGVGRIAGYLTAEYSLADAAQYARLDGAWWIAGNPLQCSVGAFDTANAHVRVTSVGADRHRAEFTGRQGPFATLGATCWSPDTSAGDERQLIGVTVPFTLPIDSESVVDLCEQPDYAVTLNGERIHDTRRITPEFVRESARRALENDEHVEGGRDPDLRRRGERQEPESRFEGD